MPNHKDESNERIETNSGLNMNSDSADLIDLQAEEPNADGWSSSTNLDEKHDIGELKPINEKEKEEMGTLETPVAKSQYEAPTSESGNAANSSVTKNEEEGAASTNNQTDQTDQTDSEDVLAFDYQSFMKQLRLPSADPIVRYIKSFLHEFCRDVWTQNQQQKIVSDFMKFVSVKLRDFEPFASSGSKGRKLAMEGIEKLIMSRLYTRTFPQAMPPILRTEGHTEDLLEDEKFGKQLQSFSWVEPRHLDLSVEDGRLARLAAAELARIDSFRAPRDKMICILNCARAICALLRQNSHESDADGLLPWLIYVILQAQTMTLPSTVAYIQRFRRGGVLQGEGAYYLASVSSAISFIEKMDQSSLTVSTEEFDQKFRIPDHDSASVRSEEVSAQLHADAALSDASPALLEAISASELQFERDQVERMQFNTRLAQLEEMLPMLDSDLIADVLRQSQDEATAVDTCMALAGC